MVLLLVALRGSSVALLLLALLRCLVVAMEEFDFPDFGSEAASATANAARGSGSAMDDTTITVKEEDAGDSMMACGGSSVCPWCGLGVSVELHNNIEHAAARVLEMQAEMARSPAIRLACIDSLVLLSSRVLLVACAMEFRLAVPAEESDPKLQRLVQQNLLPADLTSEVIGKACEDMWAYVETAHRGGAGRGKGGGPRNRKSKTSWDDPRTAEWRQEPWVYHNPARRREIRVFGGKATGWIKLPPEPTQILLRWYDGGQLGDIYEGLRTDPDNDHSYDYRIEGGKYLTQRNVNRSGEPRECHIVYGEAP